MARPIRIGESLPEERRRSEGLLGEIGGRRGRAEAASHPRDGHGVRRCIVVRARYGLGGESSASPTDLTVRGTESDQETESSKPTGESEVAGESTDREALGSPFVLALYSTSFGTPDGPSGAWLDWKGGEHRPERRDERGWSDLQAAHHPLDGPYDSLDTRTLRRHVDLADTAWIDAWVVPWSGVGDRRDTAFGRILEVIEESGSRLRATVRYETCGGSLERAEKDLEALIETYATRRALFRVDGSAFVLLSSKVLEELATAEWVGLVKRLRESHSIAICVESRDEALVRAAGAWLDGGAMWQRTRGREISVEARAARAAWGRQLGALSVLPVVPGRSVTGPGAADGRRGGATYRENWLHAAEFRPRGYCIASFNDWAAGTEIEPSREHAFHYLDATRRFAMFRRLASGSTEAPPSVLTAPGGERSPIAVRVESDRPVALLDRDRFRNCRVLVNLSTEPIAAELSGTGVVVSVETSDDARRPGRAYAVADLTNSRVKVDLDPTEELHFWERDALESYRRAGGYRSRPRGLGDELTLRLRLGLFSPRLPRDGRGRTVRVLANTATPLRPSMVSLTTGVAHDAGDLALSPLVDEEEMRDPRSEAGVVNIRWERGELLVGREVAPGSYRFRASVTGRIRRGPAGAEAEQVRRIVLTSDLTVDVVEPFALSVEAGESALAFEAIAALPLGDENNEVRWSIGPAGERAMIESIDRVGAGSRSSTSLPIERIVEFRETVPVGSPWIARLDWRGGTIASRFFVDAHLSFARGVDGSRMRHVGYDEPGDGRSVEAIVAVRPARVSLPVRARAGARGKSGRLYFDVDDAFVGRGAVSVRVAYLDSGGRSLDLQYDGEDGRSRRSKPLSLSGSSEWRAHTFRLEGVRFSNGQPHGADFSLGGDGPITISDLRLLVGGDS